ncbi:rhodanese domain-containing protein [Rhodococcus ruber BKS 20-38]|uniref:Rhodanese domain-containing protein n=1 Tax=Rhodococcus ruber BKS 20-38 TaxID=1278076 RepID=M2YT58_9NOCA|nr:rhodanese-like domain-containing protein [Rhodococcus ruber]EME51529.1 rhodanese domain-containing protein [Rhodococcus ruber BKS 20-38]
MKTSKELREQAEAEVTTLSVDEAIALHGRDDVVFVDLREANEADEHGRVPDAFPCPRGVLEFWMDQTSDFAQPVFGQDRQFVFFCAGGGRSALATKTAQDMGRKRVAHVAGGFNAWKAAGGPTTD